MIQTSIFTLVKELTLSDVVFTRAFSHLFGEFFWYRENWEIRSMGGEKVV